ncbi:MAG: hypothetical protein WC496_07990 [Phycisphaerae bacterium]|jgi:hypothetical protein
MFNNPLIKRYRLSAMRPAQVVIYVVIYLVVLSIMGMINEKLYGFCPELFKQLYFQLFFIQAMFLLAWSSYNSSAAIREEIVTNSFDFFKMLPLTANQKTVGILIGKNLFVLILAAINFILMTICGFVAEINMMLQLQIISVTAAVSILINSFALLGSIQPDMKKNHSGIALIVLMMFFFIPLIGNAVAAIYGGQELEKLTVYFYTLEIPLIWLIALIALYFACWTIKGVLRKFTYERSPLFTPFGAFLFLIGYGFVILGLFKRFLSLDICEGVNVYAFWWVCFIPVIVIPFLSRKSFENYIEYLGGKQFQSSGRSFRLAMFCNSNLLTGVFLYLIWTVFALVSLWIAKSDFVYKLLIIATYFTSYMFFVLMLELFNVISPSIKKIGILLGFIFGLYVVLPLILAGVFDNEQLVKYSPFGLMVMLLDSKEVHYKFFAFFIVYNIALSSLPAFFIARRYFYIIKTRKEMLLST